MASADTEHLKACHCCGLVQTLPRIPTGHVARCTRCSTTIRDPRRGPLGNQRAAAAALAALILYPFAVGLPIMQIERLGRTHESSIWQGSVELLSHGQLFVGLVVLLCSILLPLVKLVLLLLITKARPLLSQHGRAHTYRWIEWAGRWGMLDVLLIAVLVAWLKLRDVVAVEPGPAAWTFTLMVLMSLLASTWFDPHAVWDRDEKTNSA